MLDVKIIKHGGELHQFNCKVILYGMGQYGRALYGEGLGLGYMDDLFVCDSNKIVCSQFPNCVQKETLREFVHNNADAVVVICVQNEAIVQEIYNDIMGCGWKQENIYQYIPETVDEFINRKNLDGFYNGQKSVFILENHEAGECIENMIMQKIPFLVARWGNVEGSAVYNNKIGMLSGVDLKYMYNNAGIFPIDDSGVKEFISVTEHAAGQMDIMCAGFWCRHIEPLFRMFSPRALLASDAILPPTFVCQWMRALEGKKVLVIHPFAPLIEEQYKKRKKLFKDPWVLPDFKLSTYKAVQSMGGCSQYPSWVKALEKMESDIAEMDFDISLIGCGAYGMPLGAFIKEKLCKQALHVGGQLQLLFGIKGRRWDMWEGINCLYNEYWVRPTTDLRPYNYKSVENGCYW